MHVKVYKEEGIEEALLGLSLSYYDHATPIAEWWSEEKKQRAYDRAEKQAHMQGGHNKFIESINIWVYIQASRGFWQEFDTYRVGMTKQSTSTMHTLDKREVNVSDFEESVSTQAIAAFNVTLKSYKDKVIGITELKDNLPEGWLQERMVCLNYKTLQNIINQRKNHRLTYWRQFCKEILEQIEHPEYIIKEEIEEEQLSFLKKFYKASMEFLTPSSLAAILTKVRGL